MLLTPSISPTKSVNTDFVIVGDILTYTIIAQNTGDINLGDPVVVFDILNSSLEFVPGSVTVGGVSNPDDDIISGVDIGSLSIGEIKVITFKAKDISNEDQNLLGYQMIIEGNLKLFIEYTSLNNTCNSCPSQSVYSYEHTALFTESIVLAHDCNCSNFSVTSSIDYIYFRKLDCRSILTDTILTIKVINCCK